MRPHWDRMNREPRWSAVELSGNNIPTAPGVYACNRDGEPIYAGCALGAMGLRGRVWTNHLAVGNDLSRSSFRRNVCEHIGIATTATTRIRPTIMRSEQVHMVNEWIRECDISWSVCPSSSEAKQLERTLLREWMPPLSRR